MRKIIKNISSVILFVLMLMICLMVLELYIRSAEIESLSNFEVDSVYGKRLLPDRKMLYVNEGFYVGKTNKYGYLGPSYPPEKDNNTIRIALIGDSFIEAFQLFDRNSLRALLEKELCRRTGKRVEVMNFGRSGFNLEDMYVYYEMFCKKFKPDLTLFFIEESDLTEDSHQTLMPVLVPGQDTLFIENSFRHSNELNNYYKTKWIRENSAFLKMINNCKKLVTEGKTSLILFDKFYINRTKKSSAEGIFAKEVNTKISGLNQKILSRMSTMPGIEIILIGNIPQNLNMEITDTGLPVINLIKSLESMKNMGNNPWYWPSSKETGHWNPEAHRELAGILSTSLILQDRISHNSIDQKYE